MKILFKRNEEEKPVNEGLVSKIQPQLGISFKDDRYIKLGDGYVAVLYVYGYRRNVGLHWMMSLLSIEDSIVDLDVATEDTTQALKAINKSMKEQSSRTKFSKDYGDVIEAQEQFADMDGLYSGITAGDSLKLIKCRIFVSGKTLYEVDTRVSRIINSLRGKNYEVGICIGETKNEWQSMLRPYQKQLESVYKREGQPIPASILAKGNPFHFSALSDPFGIFYGFPSSTGGGSVIFDPFRIGVSSTSYSGVVVGKMGYGKSTLLKKMMMDRASRGDYVRVFDPTGEYKTLTEHLGGKIISLDGSTSGKINALEIFRTDEDPQICYNQHLSKMSTIYKYLRPGADQYDIITFEEILGNLYQKFNLVPDKDNPGKQITGLDPGRYPTFSQLSIFIRQCRESMEKSDENSVSNTEKIKRYERIETVIQRTVDNYGNIFDGATSMQDLTSERIVTFDIKNLLGMSPEIFDAQLFNALSLCWDNCVEVGSKMKALYDRKEIEIQDTTKFLIILDEAHRIINTRKTAGVEQIAVYAREARKYFGGIIMASQSIRDFVPDHSDNDAVQMIRTLFELTAYKFIMNQDSNCRSKLNEVFEKELTENELDYIPRLIKGEAILVLSGDKNIWMHIHISDEEEKLFTGGA